MASQVAGREALHVLRSIIKELRHVRPGSSPRNLLAYQYIMDQFRSNQVTTEKICRAQPEMIHKAKSYLSLLEGLREHEVASRKDSLMEEDASNRVRWREGVRAVADRVLNEEYKGKEKSIEESARLVGLRLPIIPEPK